MARSTALLGCCLLGCNAANEANAVILSDAGEGASPGDASASPDEPTRLSLDAGPDELFPANWCTRAGTTAAAQANAMLEIGSEFFTLRTHDCRTRGLSEGMTGEQSLAWENYLIAYTYVMVGCRYLMTVPGGILAFGPANTAAIGVPRPPIGEDDVTVLIELYVGVLADHLRLTPRQYGSVQSHLFAAARPEIEPGASGVLSRCGDAAADGGR